MDQRRLQGAAWARFHTARKRLEKAARDLHRHEEIDHPAYELWLHRTFPLLVTTLRELHDEAAAKSLRIARVQAMAFKSGRSVKRLWREEKERELDPSRRTAEDQDPGLPRGDEDLDEAFRPRSAPPRSPTAREIYRRLVLRLHPDHGGPWTIERQRLWHEVQQAWAAGNTDWLSRLEMEWETAHEVLGPTSPVGRLYRAIEELDAARRDTERKLRDYRRSPSWRFMLTESKRSILEERIEAGLHAEIAMLRRQMRPMDAMIAAWEDDWTRADHRTSHNRRRRTSY
jgi:hypothetical protein